MRFYSGGGAIVLVLILIILSIPLLSPFTLSLSVNIDSGIYDSFGEITTIPCNKPLTISVVASITPLGNYDVWLFPQNLSSHDFYRSNQEKMSCTVEGDNITCVAPAILYQDGNHDTFYKIKVVNREDLSDTYEETFHPQLTIDSEKPIITSIESIYKDSNRDYIKSGNNGIIVHYEKGPFLKKKMRIKLNNNYFDAMTCDESKCNFYLTTNCDTDNQYNLMVVNPSQDDAGNMVDYSQGVTSLTLYCDNNEPQIKSFEYTSTNPIDKNVFQKGDNIVVNYELEDISDKIMIVVDGEGVGSGKIVKKDMERIGSINIPIEKEGPYSVRIPITFYDAANNSVEESINIDVLSGVSNAQSNSYEGIWEIKSISIKPSKLSTKLLSTVGTYALITLKLKEKRKINNLVIIPSKTKSSCRILGSSGETVALCNLDLIGTDKDTLNLLIEFSQGEYGEGDKINATISFYTKSKDTVFYDTLNISKKIEYQNTKYLLTEETIVNLKQSLQNKSEDIQGKIEGIHTAYNTIEGIKLIACDTGQTLGTIGKLMRITQLTLSATGKGSGPFYASLESAAKMVKKGGDTSDKTHDTLNKNLKIDTVCKVLSCNSDLNKWFISTEGGSFEKLGPLKQFFEETTEVDPYNSILEATVTVCPSAFLYHIENFYALQCNELLCSYSSLDLGVDISHCKTQYSRDLCYFVLKGVPNLISLVRVYDRVVEEVSSIMTSPAHAGGMALSFIFNHLCSADEEPISNAICKLPFYYKYLGDIKEVVKTWEYYKEEFNTDEEVNTGCRILTTIDEKYRENKKQLISRIDSPMWYSCVNGICYLKDSPVEIDNGKVYYHGESPFYAYDMNKEKWVVVTPSSKDEAKISYSTGDPGNDFLREFYDKYHKEFPEMSKASENQGTGEKDSKKIPRENVEKARNTDISSLISDLLNESKYSIFLEEEDKEEIKDNLNKLLKLKKLKQKIDSKEFDNSVCEDLNGIINEKVLEEYSSSCQQNSQSEKCNKAKKKLIDEIEKQKEKIGEKIKKDINNALQNEQLKEYWSSDRATYDTYVHLVSFFQTVGRTMQLAGIHVDVTNFPVLSSFQSAGAFVRRLHTDEMVKAMCNRIGSHEEMEGMGTAEYSSPVLRKNILQIVAYRESYYNASSQKLENRYVVGYTLMNPKDKIMNYEIVIKNNKKEKILKEGSLESGKGTYEFLYYPRDVNSEYKEACVKVSNFLYFFEGYRLPGNDYICTKIKGGWSGNG